MFQNTIVAGYLGQDPEMRYLPSGTPVTNFSLAANRAWTDSEGVKQKRTTWFRVSCFGRLAETTNEYLSKGRPVLVEGDVSVAAYTRRDGEPGAALNLRARSVTFMGRGDQADQAEPAQAKVDSPAEDEIPF